MTFRPVGFRGARSLVVAAAVAVAMLGASSPVGATGFTGSVMITQWFGKPYDGDWAC
jgi:hypothetical protein